MKGPRVWLVVGAAILAAVAGYRLASTGVREPAALVTPPPGAPPSAATVFALQLRDPGGGAQPMTQWRGKVLVVNYWATWCLPCRDEMPGFSRLHEAYRDKGVQFVGISMDDADKVAEFIKTTPVSYPLLTGDLAAIKTSADLGNARQALPFTALIDRDGRVVATRLGRLGEAELDRELTRLVAR